jgi:hypothetical protein
MPAAAFMAVSARMVALAKSLCLFILILCFMKNWFGVKKPADAEKTVSADIFP